MRVDDGASYHVNEEMVGPLRRLYTDIICKIRGFHDENNAYGRPVDKRFFSANNGKRFPICHPDPMVI